VGGQIQESLASEGFGALKGEMARGKMLEFFLSRKNSSRMQEKIEFEGVGRGGGGFSA